MSAATLQGLYGAAGCEALGIDLTAPLALGALGGAPGTTPGKAAAHSGHHAP